VQLDGRDVSHWSPRERAKKLAYLPQGQTLHWPLSVDRLVALGRLPHLGPLSRVSAEDRAAVAEAMERADVGHLAGRTATELSGGERARVMLARALAVGAAGLVVDEPLASLDPGHQIDVMELLAREARGGALVIAVLHDLTMAARYCDRLVLMDGGKLVAEGAPREVLTAERLRAVYGISAMVDLSGDAPMVVPLQRT
ncbi:MAG TPA: ABC transporter ATP-binding protein, partial [Novosphingobium sp.]